MPRITKIPRRTHGGGMVFESPSGVDERIVFENRDALSAYVIETVDIAAQKVAKPMNDHVTPRSARESLKKSIDRYSLHRVKIGAAIGVSVLGIYMGDKLITSNGIERPTPLQSALPQQTPDSVTIPPSTDISTTVMPGENLTEAAYVSSKLTGKAFKQIETWIGRYPENQSAFISQTYKLRLREANGGPVKLVVPVLPSEAHEYSTLLSQQIASDEAAARTRAAATTTTMPGLIHQNPHLVTSHNTPNS